MTYPIEPSCQIQNFQNILTSVFGDNHIGTFVEVGAYDGKTYSNTYGLATIGWQGVYIEPVLGYYEQCFENHEKHDNVRCLCTGISNIIGSKDFYTNGDLVTSSPQMAETVKANKATKLSVTTLDVILEQLDVQPGFELLVIDVEGSEMEVLEGFSILSYHPAMIIIETHEYSDNPDFRALGKPVLEYFQYLPYNKIYSDHINSIYTVRDFVEMEEEYMNNTYREHIASIFGVPVSELLK